MTIKKGSSGHNINIFHLKEYFISQKNTETSIIKIIGVLQRVLKVMVFKKMNKIYCKKCHEQQ